MNAARRDDAADDAAPRVHSVTRSKAGRESARTHGAHVVSKPHQNREMNKLSFSATFAMIISTASACTEIQLRSPTGATPLTRIRLSVSSSRRDGREQSGPCAQANLWWPIASRRRTTRRRYMQRQADVATITAGTPLAALALTCE